MNVQYRPMRPDDYEAAARLWATAEGVGLSEGDDAEAVAAFLARNPGLSFVACDGDTLVGAVLAGHDGRRGHLYHLAVDPAYRRRGIGRALTSRALQGLAAAGIHKCHVHVYGHNADGLGFWRADGWVDRTDLTVLSRLTRLG